MSCEITLRVKGKSFTYTTNLKPEQITLENIVNEIYNSDIEYKTGKNTTSTGKILVEVVKSLSNAKSIYDSTESIKERLKECLTSDKVRVVGNYTLDMLCQKFPKVKIDGNLKTNEEIIYSKDLNLEGVGLGGKLVIGNQSIFIISDEQDAYKLRNYLKVRDEISKEDFQFSELSSQEKEALDYIKNKKKFKDDLQALKYFFENSSEFLFELSKNNVDIYTVLKNYIKKEIVGKSTREELKNPIANTLIQRAKYQSWNSNYVISPNLFKNVVEMFNEQDNISWIDKEAYKNGDEETRKKLKQDFVNSVKQYVSSQLIDSNRPFDVYVSDKGFIYILSPYQDISYLDYEFNTFKAASKAFEKGPYKVFNIGGKYYITKEKVLTLNSYLGAAYDSQEKAVSVLNQRLNKTSIADGYNKYLLRFPKLDKGVSKITIPNFKASENTIIETYDYNELPSELSLKEAISEKYYNLISYTIPELQSYIKNEIDQDVNIDSFEKAMIFIIELSKTNNVQKALDNMNSVITHQYLVVNKVKSGQNYNVIVTDEFDYNEKQQNTEEEIIKFPISTVLQNTINLLNEKWRLSQNKGNNDYLIKLINPNDFKEEGIPDTINKRAKGFIYNGIIYMNQAYLTHDTLFHELGHLILGIMKAESFDTYMNLLNEVSRDMSLAKIKRAKSQQEEYANLSDEDLTEEAFVEMFGNYIKGNHLQKASLIENKTNKTISQAIEKFGGIVEGFKTLSDLFSNLKSYLLIYLQQGTGLNYNETLAKNRKITNHIKKMLETENLIMKC